MYNIVTIPVACRCCGLVAERDLQLHYGAKGLHRYRVGDELIWGQGNGKLVGDAAAARVWCPCYAEQPCPGCGDDNEVSSGFAVVIDHGTVSAVFQAPLGSWFPDFPEWTQLEDGERPTAVGQDDSEPSNEPAAALQTALSELLGFIDHDTSPDSVVPNTPERILQQVRRMRVRLATLTSPDQVNRDLRAAIDNEILAGRRIQAVLAIREQLGCGIREAVDILNDRFLILSQFRSADFTVDTEM